MLKKIFTPDVNLQKIQDNVDDALRPLQHSPLAQGLVLASNISLTANKDNLISHGLKKVPSFWLLAGQNANANVWSPASTELSNKSANTSYINLWCSVDCTVNLIFG
jgi:hypothetical protein